MKVKTKPALSAAGTDQQQRFCVHGRDQRETTDRHGNTYTGRRFWSQAYRDLVDNETMLPILQELLGDPAWGHAPAHMPVDLRPLIRLDQLLETVETMLEVHGRVPQS